MTAEAFTREVLFKATDAPKRLVYGVVSEPDSVDSQDDVLTADEIEKMAHGFLLDSRKIGDQHRKINGDKLLEADAGVVESFIAPVDFEVGGESIRKGSWVMVVKIHSPEMWADVEKGEYGGFSIGGFGERTPMDAAE